MDLTLDGIIKLIQQIGFPIAVALWFMFRTDKKIEKMTEALREVKEVLARIARNGDA